MTKTIFVDDTSLNHLFATTKNSSQTSKRNLALLYANYGTGMMLTELATIKVSNYLKPNGEILTDSIIRSDISYNGKERKLYWSNEKVTNSIDKYLDYRLTQKHRTVPNQTAYRGLAPESPIFLTRDGFPYLLTQRITRVGTKSYSCDSLSQLFRHLHKQAGIDGASAMSGRKTFAVRLHQSGYDIKFINELLGHETLTATKNFINRPQVNLSVLVSTII